MQRYMAVIHRNDGTSFGVSFPDFPGHIAAGETLDEAAENASLVLAMALEACEEDGESAPAASTLEQAQSHPDYGDALAFLFVEPRKPSKTVRINVSIDEELLSRIDRAARAHRMKRSAFLAEAARRMMHGS